MAEVLSDLSRDLASTVDASSQFIVRVEGRRRLPASGIVWSKDGVIVTAHHVIEGEGEVSVGLPDGQTVTATLAGRDPTTDLAVLKASTADLNVPTWVESDSLQVGHLVLALGRPGQTVRATLGIVSALGKSWHTPAGGRVESYLQTDVTMYPGFSGGPLVDAAGRFVGLNTSALLRGISITVPSPTLKRLVEMLSTHGKVRRGYIGIGGQPVRLPQALSNQQGQETGLMLVSIEPDSPADRHGLLLGDTILAFDGQPIRRVEELLTLLGDNTIGKEASVSILRGGSVQQISLTIGERT